MRSLKRILKRKKLRRRGLMNYANLRAAGFCILKELEQSGSLLGYRAMWHLLRTKYKRRVPRLVVREMLRQVDPVSVRMRRQHKLHRRTYRSKGPNYCWHLDGNDKLKMFGFYIHGCIDGYSRKIEVATTNKDSGVIAGYFLKAIEACKGYPKLIRADLGTENARVAYLQPFLRRNGSDSLAGNASFLYGKSVNNQRIEAMWSTLKKWCLDWWIDFFKRLRDEHLFDDSNPIHVDCLRLAFMDILQEELEKVAMLWNSHLIRRSKSETVHGIPNELYHIPELRGVTDFKEASVQEDVDFSRAHTSPKPPSVPEEFEELCTILFEENSWSMPNDISGALELFINLSMEITT